MGYTFEGVCVRGPVDPADLRKQIEASAPAFASEGVSDVHVYAAEMGDGDGTAILVAPSRGKARIAASRQTHPAKIWSMWMQPLVLELAYRLGQATRPAFGFFLTDRSESWCIARFDGNAAPQGVRYGPGRWRFWASKGYVLDRGTERACEEVERFASPLFTEASGGAGGSKQAFWRWFLIWHEELFSENWRSASLGPVFRLVADGSRCHPPELISPEVFFPEIFPEYPED